MDKNLYRILSGLIRCKVDGAIFTIRPVTHLHKYMAEEVYEEALDESLLGGCWPIDSHQFNTYLLANGLDPNYRQRQNEIKKEIEKLKLEIYQLSLDKKDSNPQRNAVGELNKENISLLFALHRYDYITAEGIAELQKARFLLRKALKRQVVTERTLDKIAAWLADNRISEADYRALARSNAWALLSTTYTFSLFHKGVQDPTEEQLSFFYWADFYNNVYKHDKRPPTYIIDDDLALDGWCITQAKKSLHEQAKDYVNSKITSPEAAQAGEVFIFGGDRKLIHEANDDTAKAMIKAKLGAVDKGKFDESKHV